MLYIGKAKNLKNRVSSYFKKITNLGPKTQIFVSQIEKIRTIEVSSEIEALLLEANYIKKFKPKYNVRLTDGKSYPLIRITVKDKYPKVLISRKTDDKKSIYFGPYPSSSAVTLVLKTIRKIFPYQSVLNHTKKICLYNHLELCPCPEVTRDKEYRKTIRRIITFLNGNTKKVIESLAKERNVLSRLEKFEEASDLQRKIDSIDYVTTPSYKNFEYIVNPNLDADMRNKELYELKTILVEHNVNVKKLNRIECYDISNTSGTNATGSMVVFTNGESDKPQYRKFKIKILDTPNDFAMIQQVLQRRMKHFEWRYPDLIIVDGGKGQVSSAMSPLSTMKQFSPEKIASQFNGAGNETMNIPVIGIAKRKETIVTSDFKEIKLPRDSEAIKLLMRIRDEAHRFAITYHRKLRSRSFLQNH